jgi:hypothetical protein
MNSSKKTDPSSAGSPDWQICCFGCEWADSEIFQFPQTAFHFCADESAHGILARVDQRLRSVVRSLEPDPRNLDSLSGIARDSPIDRKTEKPETTNSTFSKISTLKLSNFSR